METDVSLVCLCWELPTHQEDESDSSTALVLFQIVSEGWACNQSRGQKWVDSQPNAHHKRKGKKICACDANFTNDLNDQLWT